MKFSKNLFVTLILLSTTVMRPDATDDLFSAIEKNSFADTKKALDAGADINKTRAIDGKSPHTLVWQKLAYEEGDFKKMLLMSGSLCVGAGATLGASAYKSKVATVLALASCVLAIHLTNDEDAASCEGCLKEQQERAAWKQKIYAVLHKMDHMLPGEPLKHLSAFSALGLATIATSALLSKCYKTLAIGIPTLLLGIYTLVKFDEQKGETFNIYTAIQKRAQELEPAADALTALELAPAA